MRTTAASDAIVQEIIIKASAERIFEALTNPDQRVKWWGSEGRFQTTHMESDLRPGGRWVMRVSETSRESHKGWPQILAWLRAYVEG